MAVFRDISIPYQSAEYVVTPSNRVCRRIEMKGQRENPMFGIASTVYRATNATGGFYDLAFVLSELINSSGGQTTEDHALAELTGKKSAQELGAYIALICSCVVPEAKADVPKKNEVTETIAA